MSDGSNERGLRWSDDAVMKQSGPYTLWKSSYRSCCSLVETLTSTKIMCHDSGDNGNDCLTGVTVLRTFRMNQWKTKGNALKYYNSHIKNLRRVSQV